MSQYVQSDGATVWVHKDGFTVARFGVNGIDIHTADATGCIDCTHEVTTELDWHWFCAGVLQHHGIEVKSSHMPHRFR